MKTAKRIFFSPARLVRHTDWWVLVIFLVIPFAFVVDRQLNIFTQWLPAIVCWWLLLIGLKPQTTRTKLLVMTLVVVATTVELTFSLVLHWYTYRLDNIPPWIPPAHGVVFLSAILWSRQHSVTKYTKLVLILITIAAAAYAVTALLLPQHDLVGFGLMTLFLVWLWLMGRQKARFYAMMWLLVCYLEICGVALGAWHWGLRMPHTVLTEGNPPSGIVGGYGLMDLTAFIIVMIVYHVTNSRQQLAKAVARIH